MKNRIQNEKAKNKKLQKYDLIYLVDDFDMVNLMHRILYRKLGLEDSVRAFTNPEKALEDLRMNLEGEKAILILLDINMPEMTGFEFLEIMINEAFPTRIDVIMVTSSISLADKELEEEYPQFVRDYVIKPLNLERLTEITTIDFMPKK